MNQLYLNLKIHKMHCIGGLKEEIGSMDRSFRKLCWQKGAKQWGSNSFKGESKKFFFHAPHKILVPQPGIKPVPPAVGSMES